MSKKNKLQSLINQRLKQIETGSFDIPKENKNNIKNKKTQKVKKEQINKNSLATDTKNYLKSDLIKIALVTTVICILIIVAYIFKNNQIFLDTSEWLFRIFNRN